jgi:hypothetical protein
MSALNAMFEAMGQSNARNRGAGLLASRHDLALEFGGVKPAGSLRWSALHSVHLFPWWTLSSALKRALSRCFHRTLTDVLVIDEVGYLSFSNRAADLLFELISRRYQTKSTVVTTNKAFADWGEVFPNAACVVSLIDRLMHRAEVVRIDGDSYRAKEAQERESQRKAARSATATAQRPRKAPR